jgi:hypothetical protein
MEPMLRCGLGYCEFKRFIVPENSEHCKLAPVDATVEHCDLVKFPQDSQLQGLDHY